MSDVAICPDRQDLSACAVLHELELGDTLAETMRTVGGQELVLDDDVRAVMVHLKEFTLPGKAMEETLARTPEPTEDAWDLEKLLDPPEAEGELGRFGGYRVLRVLGAGGMGMVLEAEDPKLRRRVALKVMKRWLAARDEHHQRFLREARAAAAIEHPHIVTVHQVGEHNGVPFMAMQLLKGEALDDRLRREAARKEDGLPGPSSTNGDGLGRPSSRTGALPLDEVLRIGRETAEALAEAHQRNLIHRDIKPGNIWLEGARGWVKLVDFGLAHAAEDVHLTQTGAILGTPAYMSPEQARGEAVNGRTDLYSLGAVLYKLTTGDVPFKGASTMAVLMALATETPKPPRERNHELPPALNDLILRLLAKQPGDRFESAAAVAEAIRAIEEAMVAPTLRGGEAVAEGDLLALPSRSAGSTVRRRPRWPFVLAAAAAAFILAAIVIIVRDKDGKELARLRFDGAASAEVVTDAAASNVDPALRDGSASRSPLGRPGSPPRSVGATLPEPPPLEEWLKDRTVLTVAQDGSAQFKTIQAALDSLQAGQVVKVLDRGPYREFIRSGELPPDAGLISDRQTVIEAPDWQGPDGMRWAHSFGPLKGFRLSGLRFIAPSSPPPPEYYAILHMNAPSGLVVEDCFFGCTVARPPGATVAAMSLPLGTTDTAYGPVVVRDCLLDAVALNAEGGSAAQPATLLVERNYFRETVVSLSTCLDEVVIRHNVFGGFPGRFWISGLVEIARVLEISNNTLSEGVSLVDVGPIRGVVLRNNIIGRVGVDSYELPVEAVKNWRQDHNSYLIRPRFATSPTDVIGDPPFVSTDPSHRNYWRLPADGPLARGGAGGDWPDYIGALPPGPAPKEGDWFTRLRERWTKVDPALRDGSASPAPDGRRDSPPRSVGATAADANIPPPVRVPEPPPLEEWLKGREVLTVAQDGSGQFKTIPEALNALKPHQVVKVLDRGSYRESIHTGGLPDDTGLISDQQATVETLAWPDSGLGHIFGPTEKFRLAGMRFVAPPRDAWGAIVFCAEPSGLVIEDCCFALTAALDPSRSVAGVGFALENEASDDSPIVVRDCLFDYAILSITGAVGHSTFVIERNYFRNSNVGLGNRLDRATVRHNVFDGAKECFWIYGLSDVSRELEISNNTAATGVAVVNGAPLRGVVLRNNITGHDVDVDEEVYKRRAEMAKNWQRDHNSYLRRPLFAKSPTDVTVEPAYLSSEPADRNYLRIPADGPQAIGGAGGEWPSYIGALPPGPAPKEGDWFTRLRERWTKVGPALRDGIASPSPQGRPGSPPRSVGATFPEPPPLEEWLKGRTVLTVAQDGSGQFKTIQAALDALKPHQAVKVLDQGPYRERLERTLIPADTGIVSQRRTVLELSGWRVLDDGANVGHVLNNVEGFRLSGFMVDLPDGKEKDWGLYLLQPNGFVLENCFIHAPANCEYGAVVPSWSDDEITRPLVIRDCLFTGPLEIPSRNKNAVAVIERCFFGGSPKRGHLGCGPAFRSLAVKHNIFAGQLGCDVFIHGLADSCSLEISHNTLLSTEPIKFVDWRSAPQVRVCNNLRTGPGLLALGGRSAELPSDVLKRWKVGLNSYPRQLEHGELDLAKGNIFPKAATDQLGEPQFMSTDPSSLDYLRIAADGPLAKVVDESGQADYIGALPPGPAPKEGDWFTRLQERWRDAAARSQPKGLKSRQ